MVGGGYSDVPNSAQLPPTRWLTKIMFFFLGMATLIPWNSFLNSLASFDCKLQSLHTRVDNVITFTFAGVVSIGTFIVVGYGERFRFRPRMVAGFSCFAVIMFSVWGFAQIPAAVLGFIFTLLCIAGLGLSDACCETAMYGLAPIYRQREARAAGAVANDSPYTHSAQAGQAFAGVFASLLAIIVQAIFPSQSDQMNKGVYIYFTIGGFISAMAALLSYKANADDDASVTVQAPRKPRKSFSLKMKFRVFSAAWPLFLALFCNYLCSLAIFPSTFLRINPVSFNINYWFIFLLFLWNLGDFIGKMFLAELTMKYLLKSLLHRAKLVGVGLLFFTIVRGALIVTGYLTIAYGHWQVSDVGMFLMTCLGFGATNGTVSGITMSMIPPTCGQYAKTISETTGLLSNPEEGEDGAATTADEIGERFSEMSGYMSLTVLLLGINGGLLFALLIYNESPSC